MSSVVGERGETYTLTVTCAFSESRGQAGGIFAAEEEARRGAVVGGRGKVLVLRQLSPRPRKSAWGRRIERAPETGRGRRGDKYIRCPLSGT